MVHLTFWQPSLCLFLQENRWKKNKDKPQTPCKYRDFRFVLIITYGHTFATHALTSGVDAKTLSGILGHTNASFTLDTYTHVTGDMQKRAADVVGSFITDIFGEELKPWQENEKPEKAAST